MLSPQGQKSIAATVELGRMIVNTAADAVHGLTSKQESDANKSNAPSSTTARPEGVPDNWTAQPTKKGGGTEYVNPDNAHDRVRAMPGNPNSPNPAQQEPYVKWQKSGQPLDKSGKPVKGDSPEAHIPRKDFKFPKEGPQ